MNYSIGIDFGTESGRVVLVNTSNGKIIASYSQPYKHGTISHTFNGQKLPHTYFLQCADDYLEVMRAGVSRVLNDSHIDRNDVIGIGIDLTSSTIVFLDENFEPLHKHPHFQNHPHTLMSNYGNITAPISKRLRLHV